MPIKNTSAPIVATETDKAALTVGANYTLAQNNLMKAYNLKEGGDTAAIKELAKSLGVNDSTAPSIRGLQIIAEQRFNHSSNVLNMFTNILGKMDELKQRLIAKFAN